MPRMHAQSRRASVANFAFMTIRLSLIGLPLSVVLLAVECVEICELWTSTLFAYIWTLFSLRFSAFAYLVVVQPTIPFNLEAKTMNTQVNVLFLSFLCECFRLAAQGALQYHIICLTTSAY